MALRTARRHPRRPTRPPTVVLNLGMGVESSAILLRWLVEPKTRWSPLRRLIVIIAQVGSESARTKWLMEHVLFPLLRQHRVRTVQVARGGHHEADGIVVLADTRQPTVCHTGGHYTLTDEMLTAGTVPQLASGKRRCSLKFKGAVLDRWLAETLGTRPFTQVMGFNCAEQDRIADDRSYATAQRATRYPLDEWEWNRERCEAYLLAMTNQPWVKSACAICPFANGREHLLSRFRADPTEAALALLVEFVSMALNPNMSLFARGRALRQSLEQDGNTAALAHFTADLDARPWALYAVRRVFYAPGVADRKVESLATGTPAAMAQALAEQARAAGIPVQVDGQHQRAYVRARTGPDYPQVEHLLTSAPATVADKCRTRFDGAWARETSPYQQTALL